MSAAGAHAPGVSIEWHGTTNNMSIARDSGDKAEIFRLFGTTVTLKGARRCWSAGIVGLR